MLNKILYPFFLFFFLCSLLEPSLAITPSSLTERLSVDSSEEPWHIEADKITYDRESKTYEAEGNVRITSGTTRLIQADWASLDTKNNIAELRGNVYLRYSQNWLKGSHVIWNIKSETGIVDDGRAFFSESQFYVDGKVITKTGANEYELREGFLTSCNPQDADWKINYGEMDVTVGGYAWIKNSSLWARSLPILYWPYLVLPVKQERQSGFLIPWIGTTTLNGIEGELPFYWAIRQDMDATFFGRYMEKRGWMSGLEYRFNTEKVGEGIWQFNYLRDQANEEFQLEEGYPLETRDRFWLRSRYSLDLPYQIEAHLDLDMASDKNYLKEFVRGSTSYEYSQRIFLDQFGRGILQDRNTSFRESTLYLDQRHESSVLSLDTRYFDQLDRSLDETTLQRMPALSFSAIPSWMNPLPFYYTLDTSLVNYWRREGTRGNRVDMFPRIAYPIQWKNYLDVQPSFGVRSTGYWVDWDQNNRNEWQGRLLTDVRLDLSSRLNRVYSLGFSDFSAFQHAIRPEMIYEYVPQVDQDNIPRFDRLDYDQARHDLLFGFSTFLTSKTTEHDKDNKESTVFREFLRLEMLQQFNIERPAKIYEFDPDPKTGFANLLMRLDMMPKRFATLSYDATLLPDETRSIEHDLYLTLDSLKGQLLRFGYQYRSGYPVDEIIGETNLKILPNIYLSTYHDYSLEQQQLFNQSYGLRYTRNCWGIGVMYQKEQNDQRFYVFVNLLGLGSIGGGQSAFFAAPAYSSQENATR